jgi:hypothetical protein
MRIDCFELSHSSRADASYSRLDFHSPRVPHLPLRHLTGPHRASLTIRCTSASTSRGASVGASDTIVEDAAIEYHVV